MRRVASDAIPNPERKEPDFYVEKFSYLKMAKTGKAQYHFTGARMTHNPQDDSYDITLPVINNLGAGQGQMTMRAERATVNSDYSEVRMFDNVRMDRPPTANSEAMQVRSNYLLVLPDDDEVKTDKPVEILIGQSRLAGTGMVANNATRELRLTSNVHGTYQPVRR
jgi:lipopolysaccharide export system protein LptC